LQERRCRIEPQDRQVYFISSKRLQELYIIWECDRISDLIYDFTTMENLVIGIIGMGDMGKMYARRLSDAGWR
jgi:prephenate dehydrogenase (NADP+)